MASYLLINGPQLLLDLAVKSAAMMLVAWMLAAILRRASAATRHWVWSLALAGLLVLPVLSLTLPSWRIGLLPSLADKSEVALAKPNVETELPVPPAPVAATDPEPDRGPQTSAGSLPTRRVVNWTAAALMFWAIGMLLVIARLVAGAFRIWRLAKSASLVRQSSWVALTQVLAARLRVRSGVELRKSERVALPMTWGAWRSVVMLPADADEWPQECRRIVLLHELAHVKRRDCLTHNLAQIACALYWFNPLVWLAARQLHVERELACDDQVLEVGTRASEYASHLVEIARSFSAGYDISPVTVGMACSQLESRVRSILDPGVRRRGLDRLSAGLIGMGAVCLVLALAVVQPWSKATASLSKPRGVLQAAHGAEGRNDLRALPAQAEAVPQTPRTQPGETREAAPTERESHETGEKRGQAAREATAESDEQDNSQTKAQSSELTADQIIEMRAAGVTPEFIAAMRQQGFDNLTVRDITQLSIHGINADYIRQARSWAGDKLTVRDIVQLKISGVTPEYIAAMKQAGYDGLTARQLSNLRIHGVTPEFVETMRKAGYDKLTANQLAELKIHGIDEAFVKEMQTWAGGKPTVNELTQIKIFGVTPEFARRMKAAGFDNLPVKKLTELRIHGIDEGYIKEMRDLGFDNLTIDQLMKMRIHGVDADYVKKMRAAGFKNVSANQMIEMKVTGIDSILLKGQLKDKR